MTTVEPAPQAEIVDAPRWSAHNQVVPASPSGLPQLQSMHDWEPILREVGQVLHGVAMAVRSLAAAEVPVTPDCQDKLDYVAATAAALPDQLVEVDRITRTAQKELWRLVDEPGEHDGMWAGQDRGTSAALVSAAAEVEEYGGHHRPSRAGVLHDLLGGDPERDVMPPDDFYDKPHLYTGYPGSVKDTARVMRRVRGKPDATVTVYRAAPPEATHLNTGDWVTLHRGYAEDHARDHSDDPGRPFAVHQADVPAKHVHWAGDDLAEWGYWGPSITAEGDRIEQRHTHTGVVADPEQRTAGYAEYARDAWMEKAKRYPEDADQFRANAEREHAVYSDPKRHSQPGQWHDKRPVGWVRRDKLEPYLTHQGDQHGGSQQTIDALTDDFRHGRGWTDPIHLDYSQERHHVTMSEGNHRWHAATKAGEEYVPVVVHPMSSYLPARWSEPAVFPQAIMPSGQDSVHPSEVLPLHWMMPERKEAAAHEPVSWDQITKRHPDTYGVEHDEEEGDTGPGEEIAHAAGELAFDRPDEPSEDAWHHASDLDWHLEHVDPRHIDHDRVPPDDSRVRRAIEGYQRDPESVPPLVLVRRHGVYQVADGHHRASAAEYWGMPVRAYVAHSPHEDEPFSGHDGEPPARGPFHGAEPIPARHQAAAESDLAAYPEGAAPGDVDTTREGAAEAAARMTAEIDAAVARAARETEEAMRELAASLRDAEHAPGELLHRGVMVEVDPDDLAAKHAEGGMEAVHRHIADAALRHPDGLGTHWTSDPAVARRFAHGAISTEEEGPRTTLPYSNTMRVPVVLHAHVPSGAHETDPEKLRDAMVIGHGWSYGEGSKLNHEAEVLLRPRASVHVTHVEAALPAAQDWVGKVEDHRWGDEEGQTPWRDQQHSWQPLPGAGHHVAALDPRDAEAAGQSDQAQHETTVARSPGRDADGSTIYRGIVARGRPSDHPIFDTDWDPDSIGRVRSGLATADDILKHINTGSVGEFWHHPDFGDLEDAKDYAYADTSDHPGHDYSLERHHELGEPLNGQMGVVLEGHVPAGWHPDDNLPGGKSYDEESYHGHGGMWMGHSALPAGTDVPLVRVHYHDHEGVWHHADARGHQVHVASSGAPASVVPADWDRFRGHPLGEDADGLTYHYYPAEGGRWPVIKVRAGETPDGDLVGVGDLTWFEEDGPGAVKNAVQMIEVHPDYRRHGIASRLWAHARRINPDLIHSPTDQLPEGARWAAAVDAREAAVTPRQEPVSKILNEYAFDDGADWASVRDNFVGTAPTMRKMREDIRQHGIDKPISIDYSQTPPRVVDGHTRLYHAEALGLEHVPVVDRTFDDAHPWHGGQQTDADDPDGSWSRSMIKGEYPHRSHAELQLRMSSADDGGAELQAYQPPELPEAQRAAVVRDAPAIPEPNSREENDRTAAAARKLLPHSAFDRMLADTVGYEPEKVFTHPTSGYTSRRPMAPGQVRTQLDDRHADEKRPPEMYDTEAGPFGMGEQEVPGSRRPPTHLYRGVSEAEYEQAKARGHLQSDGRGVIDLGEGTNAAHDVRSAVSYLPQTGRSKVLKIRYHPDDEWWVGKHNDGYVRTNKPIPWGRVEAETPWIERERGSLHPDYARKLSDEWSRRGPVEGDQGSGLGHVYEDDVPEDDRKRSIDWYRPRTAALVAAGHDGESPARRVLNQDIDWPRELGKMKKGVHRGMRLALPSDVHDFVHDRMQTPSRQAQAIVEHLRASGVGLHWSPDAKIATDFAVGGKQAGDWNGPKKGETSIVLHAETPRPEHIATPQEVDEARAAGHDFEPYDGWIGGGLKEIPLSPRAPVKITGVTWYQGSRRRKVHGDVWSAEDPLAGQPRPSRYDATSDAGEAALDAERRHEATAGADPECESCGGAHATDDHDFENEFEDNTQTDWDEVWPEVGLHLHRGVGVELPDHVHRVVHDEARPVHERAQALLDHLASQPQGMHWSEYPDAAEAYATSPNHGYGPGRVVTPVRLTVHKPDLGAVETDPDRLRAAQVYGNGMHDEAEVPIREGAPLEAHAISWGDHGATKLLHHHAFELAAGRPAADPVTAAKVSWPEAEYPSRYVGDDWRASFVPHHRRQELRDAEPGRKAEILAEHAPEQGAWRSDPRLEQMSEKSRAGLEGLPEPTVWNLLRGYGPHPSAPDHEEPEEDPTTRATFFHGTVHPFRPGSVVRPAAEHGRGVTFASDTDPGHAYATADHDDAWTYAGKAHDWYGTRRRPGQPTRIPRVYEVEPVRRDSVGLDPQGRGNNAGDVRSPHGFRVLREMPMPEHMGEPDDWRH